MVATFEVLAEPNRRHILEQLRDGERTVNDMVSRMEITPPVALRHLKVLREAGVVTVCVDAQQRIYRQRSEPLAVTEEWSAAHRPFWSDRLDALERLPDESELASGRHGAQDREGILEERHDGTDHRAGPLPSALRPEGGAPDGGVSGHPVPGLDGGI